MYIVLCYHKLARLWVTCESKHTALTHHCICNFSFFHYLLQICTTLLPVCTYRNPSKLQVSESLPSAFIYIIYLCYIMHHWYQRGTFIQFRVVWLDKCTCKQHFVLTCFISAVLCLCKPVCSLALLSLSLAHRMRKFSFAFVVASFLQLSRL